MLYLQKYLTNFQKLFFGRTMRKVAIVVENFNSTEILVLQWQLYKFSNILENVKISIFPFTLSQAEMLYLQKYLTNFSKTFFWLKDEEGGYCGWKFQVHRSFGLQYNSTNFPTSRKYKNLYFSLYTVPAEMLYLQKYLTNFQKLFFGRTMRKLAIVVDKFSSAQIFWFWNSNVTTFPTSRKCKNFSFSLYTVTAEMLYLQKYLTNFQKLFLGRTMRKAAIVVENFNCTEILVLQEQRYTFSNIQRM